VHSHSVIAASADPAPSLSSPLGAEAIPLDEIAAAAKAPASPHWYPLQPNLCELMHVVPAQSAALERTTILTWAYLKSGGISFEELVARVPGGAHKTTKKKYVRRALRGLVKIGAVTLFVLASDQPPDLPADVDRDAEDGETPIGRRTAAHLTREGMTWMRRAWHARFLSLGGRMGNLSWIHNEYLQEEEEGKGNEAYWIERIGGGDGSQHSPHEGEISTLLGGVALSSIFDLHLVLNKRKPRGRSGTK